jgi:hypothetical protein
MPGGSVPVGVRRARILVQSHRLSYARLRKGRGERDLVLSAMPFSLWRKVTHRLDDSARHRIMRASSVHRQRPKPMNRRRCAWRGLNRLLDDRHYGYDSDFFKWGISEVKGRKELFKDFS